MEPVNQGGYDLWGIHCLVGARLLDSPQHGQALN